MIRSRHGGRPEPVLGRLRRWKGEGLAAGRQGAGSRLRLLFDGAAAALRPAADRTTPAWLVGSWTRIDAGELVVARTECELAPGGRYVFNTLVVGPSGSLFSYEEGRFDLAAGLLTLRPRALRASGVQQGDASAWLAAATPGPARRYRCRLRPCDGLRLVDEHGVATEWEPA